MQSPLPSMVTEPVPPGTESDDGAPSASGSTPEAIGAPDRRLPAVARFSLASVISLILFGLTYFIFITTSAGQALENLALEGAALRPDLDRLAGLERLSLITVVTFAAALAIVVGISVLQGRPQIGIAVAGLMGASVVLVEVLKLTLPRPILLDGPAWILRNSFPSGTAAVAVAIALGAMLISPDRLRWVVVPIAVVGAAVVGEATQTTGWHRLSDTLGSTFLVVAVVAAGLTVLTAVGEVRRSTRGRIDRRIRTALIFVAGLTMMVAAVVLLLAAVFPLLTSPTGGRRVFLQTAFPLIGIGCTALVLIAFAWVIEPFTLGRRREPSAPASTPGPRAGPP